MKHSFASAKSDGGDATLVRPSNWNDFHLHAVTTLTADTTLAYATHDRVKCNASVDITLTLPDAAAAGKAGRSFRILNKSASHSVVIKNAGGTTIYTLVNPDQFVELMTDGTDWDIWDAN